MCGGGGGGEGGIRCIIIQGGAKEFISGNSVSLLFALFSIGPHFQCTKKYQYLSIKCLGNLRE